MGLNLSNQQIAAKLDLNKDDVQAMTIQWRERIVAKKNPVQLTGVIEADEVFIVADLRDTQKSSNNKDEQDDAAL